METTKLLKITMSCLLFLSVIVTEAAEIRIAIASNFTDAIKSLSRDFEKKTGHKTKLIFGSTGRHYAQIKNGAPFDVFFAADSKRPELLEQEGLIITGSRFTYAIGKLVLWSPKADLIDSNTKVLEQQNFNHIAVANHKLAPYGKAAHDVLTGLNLWEKIKSKAVRGENIAQTFQFVKSGNAELGFVALSQIKHLGKDQQGSKWEIPENLYQPIKQQAVLLNNNPTAKSFMDYMKTDDARNIILNSGYGIENDQ